MPSSQLTDSEMRSCENCIHYDICLQWTTTPLNYADWCMYFKHSALLDCDNIASLQSEIERLRSRCTDCNLVKAKSETINKLSGQIESWRNRYYQLKRDLKTSEVEAVKKFAERLKGKLDICVCGYSREEVTSDVEDTIDNLLAEMERENNA